MTDYGCKYGLPHDLSIVHENKGYKWEICKTCNTKYKWRKGHKGRIDNVLYLKAHVRNFAQKFGATKRVYHKIYKPETTKITI